MGANEAVHALTAAIEAEQSQIAVQRTPKTGGVDERCVAILGTIPNQRVRKLAAAARLMGYLPIYIGLAKPKSMTDQAHIDFFESAYFTTDRQQFADLLAELRPSILHICSSTHTPPELTLLPFLIDPDRVIVDYYDPLHPKVNANRFRRGTDECKRIWSSFRRQRFAYDNAAGICTRLLLGNVVGTRTPGKVQPRLYFPEPLWLDTPPEVKKHHVSDGRLHVIYSGSFVAPKPPPEKEFVGLLWLAERAEQFGIKFDLMCFAKDPESFRPYTDLAASTDAFDLKPRVSVDDLAETIARYDVGLTMFLPPDGQVEGVSGRANNPKANWAAKVTDYVDAGIYALVPREASAMGGVLRRYNLGETPSVQQVLEKSYWDDLRARLHGRWRQNPKERLNLTIAARAPGLGELYARVRERAARPAVAGASTFQFRTTFDDLAGFDLPVGGRKLGVG